MKNLKEIMQNDPKNDDNTIEALSIEIKELTETQMMNLHNQFCESAKSVYDMIFENEEEFLNTFFSNDLNGLVRAINFGNYEYMHDYVKFDGYENLETFEYVSSEIDEIEIAQDLILNPQNYSL